MARKKKSYRNYPDDWTLSISVEDQYLLFDLNKPIGMLPTNPLFDDFIDRFLEDRKYHAILDLGNLPPPDDFINTITGDVVDFAIRCQEAGATLIISPDQHDLAQHWPARAGAPIPVARRDWKYHQFDLESLRIADSGSTKLLDGELIDIQIFEMEEALEKIGTNSLMTQLAFLPNRSGADIQIIPYHAHAVYRTSPDQKRENLLLARPAALARRTKAILAEQFFEFNSLIGQSDLTESKLQKFFERNSAFLEMLGYKAAYPKIILERDDGSRLVPDFMLEPIGTDWCDILDIKLPSPVIFTEARDRKTFSHAVHQLQAQLREYSAYFDDEKYRKRIIDKYGIKTYRPRLIGIIGNAYDALNDAQVRRVMTQYTDFDLVTFDMLSRIAKHRLLV